MTTRAVAIVILVASGCVTYSGGARTIDPTRMVREPGWIGGPDADIRQRTLLDCGPAALAMVAAAGKRRSRSTIQRSRLRGRTACVWATCDPLQELTG